MSTKLFIIPLLATAATAGILATVPPPPVETPPRTALAAAPMPTTVKPVKVVVSRNKRNAGVQLQAGSLGKVVLSVKFGKTVRKLTQKSRKRVLSRAVRKITVNSTGFVSVSSATPNRKFKQSIWVKSKPPAKPVPPWDLSRGKTSYWTHFGSSRNSYDPCMYDLNDRNTVTRVYSGNTIFYTGNIPSNKKSYFDYAFTTVSKITGYSFKYSSKPPATAAVIKVRTSETKTDGTYGWGGVWGTSKAFKEGLMDVTYNMSYSSSINTAVTMHELGHAMGLGHHSSSTQIMYDVISARTKLSWGAGDYTGLRFYRNKGCRYSVGEYYSFNYS